MWHSFEVAIVMHNKSCVVSSFKFLYFFHDVERDLGPFDNFTIKTASCVHV